MSASHLRRFTAAVGVAFLLALTGCSSSDGSSTNSAPMPAAEPMMDKEGAVPPQGQAADTASGSGAGSNGNAPQTPVDERSLIYTGTITVKVDNVTSVADRAKALAIGVGGFVTGDNRTIDDTRSQATLILRVPADRFSSTLDDLAKLGTEESRQISAQDVTDQLVDLDVRVATQEASVARVRDLLVRAQTIAEIVTLENELTRRQADLDSLKQRREKLGGLVALATITVVLHAPDVTPTKTEPETGFLAGLKDGWNGFLASVKIVLTVAGWLLPWAIALGIPVWLFLWLRRRRRARPETPITRPSIPTPPARPDSDD